MWIPARQREAVILRFYMDLPESEVAAVMRVSRGAVKSATSRGPRRPRPDTQGGIMSVEDRVRAAARATAGTVRDVRPLDLPEELPLRLPHARWGHRWAMWLAPVTAAAVVTAVAVALVTVRDARHAPPAPPDPADAGLGPPGT